MCLYSGMMSKADLPRRCFGEGFTPATLHAKWVARIKSEMTNPNFPKIWSSVKPELAKYSRRDEAGAADQEVELYEGALWGEEHDSDSTMDDQEEGEEKEWEEYLREQGMMSQAL